MDPSTQRMLERARARRQKLDEQLKNSGQETTHKRNPLQENNQHQLVKVTTEVEVVLSPQDSVKKVNVSPTKVEVSDMRQKNTVNESLTEYKSSRTEDLENDKEKNIRSQLKRLGVLYSDSQISSPIHRTENRFTVEAESIKSKKPAARVARFAALADNIKQWEDDLSHPSRGYQFEDASNNSEADKTEKTVTPLVRFPEQSKDNKKTDAPKKVSENEKEEKSKYKPTHAKTSRIEQASHNKINEKIATKKIVWDEKVLQILDSGKDTSSCKPEAPMKHSSNDLLQKNMKTSGDGNKMSANSQQISEPFKTCNTSYKTTVATPSLNKIEEEKFESKVESPSKCGGNPTAVKPLGSPRKIPADSPKAGSVLHKASIFESYSPTKKTKDPAELPVSERMAFFEKNKGQALIPKAAFSMPVPAKYLENIDNKKNQLVCSPDKGKIPGKSITDTNAVNSEHSGKAVLSEKAKNETNPESSVSSKVLSCRTLFEKGLRNEAGDKTSSEQSDRQKDLDMLRNRWNKNKCLSESQNENHNKNKETTVPVPPPLPQENCISPVKSSFTALPQVTHMIPKSSPSKEQYCEKNTQSQTSVKIPYKSSKNSVDYTNFCKMKKIRVSPPKPGKLYPCLSDIEATTTETESEVPETEQDSFSDSSIVTDSDNGNTSFGREILEAAGIHNGANSQHQSNKLDSSDSDLSESAISAGIDGCINEALAGYDTSSDSEQGGPTPPKRTRDYSRSPPKGKRNSNYSKQSQSFRYTPGGHSRESSPLQSPVKSPVKFREENVSMQVVDGDQEMPLMHSVSFYRRQQNMTVKTTPVKQIVRPPEISVKMRNESSSGNEEKLVRRKVTDLLDEISKQQTVISQASQALNLCQATVEFSGSAEQVEGERLLLLATHKRQAALHEIQRLKVEGTLNSISDVGGASLSLDKGSLLITNIALSLKKDYVRKLSSEDTCYHFVCLVRSQEQVLVTQVQAAASQNLQENCNLVWNSPLRLVDLYSDFKVTLEVYSLQCNREILPHNVKYHIGNKKETGKSWLTPKKQKQESLLIMPSIQSPAGPSAVRTSAFSMAGYVVFSLRELSRTHFTLNKVSYNSPLEGNIQVKMKSEMSVDVCERGFLTMFEDISGFGAWHRRWFVLNGSVLAYWKYPDDEKKIPIGQIDLNSCTTEQVGLVSRDICARPNTFLLETTRHVQPEDRESLVLVKCRDRTIIRNLLSTDTKEERLVWCCQLNKALAMLRAWGKQENM